MSVDLDDVVLFSQRYPEEAPYWPCAFFMHGDEIIAGDLVTGPGRAS